LYENKLQNRHFKTDDTGNSRDREGSGSRNRDKKEKEKKPKADKKANNDEEADLQRAIEESKKTAEREERNRKAALTLNTGEEVIGKRKKPAAGGDEFDFGGKGVDADKAGARDANDINDFDFGDVAAAKEEKKEPASDEFDFNFGGGDPKAAKVNEEPAAQTGDLLDLLGGLDMNAGAEPAA